MTKKYRQISSLPHRFLNSDLLASQRLKSTSYPELFVNSYQGYAAIIVSYLAVVSIIAFLATLSTDAYASTDFRSIDVKVGNKTYPLFYNMNNGGSIIDVDPFTYYPRGGELTIMITSPAEGNLDLIFSRGLYDALSFSDHPPIAFIDGRDVPGLVDPSACDLIPFRIPLEQASEKVQFITADILMEHSHPYPPRLQVSKTLVEEGETFRLVLWTDAIECDLSLVKEEKKIRIDVAGRNETDGQGFFSIAIPHELLGGNYTVLVDGKEVTFTEEPYGNLAFYSEDIPVSLLAFNYTSKATTIDIIGTSVIPEFGSSIATVIGGITVAIVVIASRHSLLQRK